MPGISKAIKTRIKSVSNTKKITKAMELVAASKMKKAVINSSASRVYARHAKELLANLGQEQTLKHPLLQENKSRRELLLVVASNRGLCGGYNTNILKTLISYIKGKDADLITIGKKAEHIARSIKAKVIASFVNLSDDIRADEIVPLTKLVISEFTKGNYSRVSIVFTDFISSIKYEPKVNVLLPIPKEKRRFKAVIMFEPEEERVLDLVLPRLTEVNIYQALLESSASEHSARMIAMKNASDNAKNMIEDLMLYYNQARQASITQEIAEIAGGAQALTNV
ncbi:ATP synthase F1 subunit gamma [Patescibacteria group bacterium]|nr:ATP synthase F1 subunit gamma [Patescibacteria group bacterium]